ncbi:MAG: T9SS type A sorting domain-containing protein [Chitinophagales bacterium]
MQRTFLAISCLLFTGALNAQSLIPNSNPFSKYAVHASEKQQVMQYRVENILIEDYDLGLWVDEDSVLYVYDPLLPYGHGNYDFLQGSNFTTEPLFALSEWMEYDGANWIGIYKYYNIFDAEDFRIATNIDAFDGVTYVGYQRNEYSYDDDGNVDTILYLDYNGGDYLELYRFIYTYSAGKIANIVYQDFSAGWTNDNLLVYAYTPGGLIDNVIYSVWDGANWDESFRDLYTYDVSDNISEKLEQDYDAGWVNQSKFVYSYDGTGFNYLVEYMGFDGVDFANYEKFDLTEFTTKLPATNTISFWDGFIWEPSVRANYFYEQYDDGLVSVENNLLSTFDIYPNPSSENINVEFFVAGQQKVTFVISDITGKMVTTQTIEAAPGKNSIQKNIATLAAGTYMMQFIGNGGIVSESFVVER